MSTNTRRAVASAQQVRREDLNHPEAFCVMVYESAGVRPVRELVWNSRDGRAPGYLRALHDRTLTLWKRETLRFAPFRVPAIGDRILVTLTQEWAGQIDAERAILRGADVVCAVREADLLGYADAQTLATEALERGDFLTVPVLVDYALRQTFVRSTLARQHAAGIKLTKWG